MRCSQITTRPVVTMAGEAVAQIKDVVYAADGGEVAGFTLAGRGIFSGHILGAEVLTDTGTALGTVVDVIVEVGDVESRRCDVVGYEI